MNLKILIFILLGIFLSTSVSAASVGYLGWEDSQGNFPTTAITQTTVNQGVTLDFHVYAFAYDDPFNVQVLLKQGNVYLLEIDFVENINNPNGIATFSQNYALNTANLNGNYQIQVIADGQSSGDNEIIQLTVNPVITPNQLPIVTDITGYSATSSGTINFQATANDPDGQVTQVQFQLYYNNAWQTAYTDSTPSNGFTYSFNSNSIHYDNNVQIRAKAYDGEDWGNYRTEGPFTILNNNAPSQLTNPNPANNALNVLKTLNQLSWQGGDDIDDVTYDVYFKSNLNNNFNLICNDITIKLCQLTQTLNYNTIYSWYVIATDEFGAQTQSSTWTFTTEQFVPPNNAPTISLISPANNAQNVNIPVTLTWNGEDQDGDLLHYTVYLNNNIVSSCNNIIQESCLLTNLQYGTTYNWRVSVTDGEETVQSFTRTFTTLSQNNPPIANIVSPATTQTINIGTTLSFIGEGTDPDAGDSITAYSWDFNEDGVQDSSLPSTSYTFNQADTYTVSFKVKDNHNVWSQPDTLIVIVNPLINHAPEVTVNYPNGGEILSGAANIQYLATDMDNDILTINIDISANNGIIWSNLATNLANTGSYNFNTNNYQNGAQYLIRVTASDSQLSDFDVSNSVFTINNQAGNIIPIAFIDTPQNNQEFFTGTSIAFTGHGIDSDGEITAYSWDFDNNNEEDSSLQSTDYTFTQVGTHVINFKVKDNENAWSDLEYVTIVINPELPEENTPPVLTIVHPTFGEWIEGYYNIEWVATDAEQLSSSLNIKIQYKRFDVVPIKIVNQIIYPLTGWVTLENSQNNDGNYNWNTNAHNIENGEYVLKITATDDEGESTEEEVEFIIDNPIILNNEPQVLSITGYTNPDFGIINFVANTFDQDGDDITQISFQLYYSGSWHVIPCIETLQNQWTCSFDSTIIQYDNNVQAKAKAYDGEDWGNNAYFTPIFTIDNTVPEEPEEPTDTNIERHKFSIVNVIPKINQNSIDLFVNIKNKGNKDEDVTIKATVIQNGLTVYNNEDLDVNQGSWKTIQLPKLNPGTYVINVQASSKDYKDNKLVVVKI